MKCFLFFFCSEQRQQQIATNGTSCHDNSTAAHSCLLFLKDLVEKQQQEQRQKETIAELRSEEKDSDSPLLLHAHFEKFFKANFANLRTLKKRFSLKTRQQYTADDNSSQQNNRIDSIVKQSEISNSSSSYSNISSSNLSTQSSNQRQQNLKENLLKGSQNNI